MNIIQITILNCGESWNLGLDLDECLCLAWISSTGQIPNQNTSGLWVVGSSKSSLKLWIMLWIRWAQATFLDPEYAAQKDMVTIPSQYARQDFLKEKIFSRRRMCCACNTPYKN